MATKPLSTISTHTHNSITKFVKILDILKEIAGNRTNEHGILSHKNVIHKLSDFEMIALPTHLYHVRTIVFCYCAVTYLLDWAIMKTLVPKYKPVTK